MVEVTWRAEDNPPGTTLHLWEQRYKKNIPVGPLITTGLSTTQHGTKVKPSPSLPGETHHFRLVASFTFAGTLRQDFSNWAIVTVKP
jgi:hypothetical protein